MDPYKYSPLNLEECSFRLIRLCRQEQGPVRCEMFHAWLDDTKDGVEYEALSYTWGDKNNLHEIEVSGMPFHVTENLHSALRHIRLRDKDRILWVDAICIDQDNPKERGHQVQQMSSIYQKAIRVIIWLGKSTFLTKMAFDYMRKLQEQALGHAYNTWTRSDERWQPLRSNIELPLSSTQESLDSFLREGVEHLLGRDWFRRAWIIQEVAQARAAEVMCGAQSVSARIFAVIPSLLELTTKPHCQAILDVMPGPSRKTSWWAEKRNLRTLLYKFRKSEASEPRDVIYALLGISSDKESANFPTPNYDLPLQDLIFNTIAYLVRLNGIVTSYDLPWWRMDHFLNDIQSLEIETLKWVAAHGRMDATELLLRRGQVEANSRDRNGSTLLEWATRESRGNVIRLLCDIGGYEVGVKSETTNGAMIEQQLDADDIEVDSTHQDDVASQSLLWAAKSGNEAMVRQQLNTDEVDVNINHPDRYGSTPLFWAAKNGHHTIVQLLLNTGKVDVNLDDQNGSTPLLWAAKNGYSTIVELLLNADKINSNLCNRNGSTPILWAARNGHDTIVQLLLDTEKVEINLHDRSGSTPILWAARNGHHTIVLLLLATCKVDVNLRDRNGSTPLWWAAKNGYNTIVNLLLDADKIDFNLCNQDGSTPILWAARNGHDTIVQLLLSTGKISVNLEDENGLTPISWAVRNGHEEAVRLLLKTRMDYFHDDLIVRLDQTILMQAVRTENEAVVKLLLNTTMFNINSKYRDRITPLEWATQTGNEAIIKLLLSADKRRSDEITRLLSTEDKLEDDEIGWTLFMDDKDEDDEIDWSFFTDDKHKNDENT
jgi:ankyrin repeat protein